jgi:hypothetical protein
VANKQRLDENTRRKPRETPRPSDSPALNFVVFRNNLFPSCLGDDWTLNARAARTGAQPPARGALSDISKIAALTRHLPVARDNSDVT